MLIINLEPFAALRFSATAQHPATFVMLCPTWWLIAARQGVN